MRGLTVKVVFLIVLMCSALIPVSYGQQVKVEPGPTEIALNQPFTITVTVENGKLKSYDQFPKIEGFVKRGTSSSSSTNYINGRFSSTQSITQNYMAQKPGTYELPTFSMTVNGETYEVPGQAIKVGQPAKRRQQQYDPFGDPFDDMFNRRQRRQPQEFIEVEDDAFFAITTNKQEVFLGEGFTLTVAFYVSEENKAPLNFHNLSDQLTDILKEVKPENCWEESFDIQRISGEPVEINGKNYTQFKIYQAVLYPLKLEDIKIPSAELEMLKYKVAKRRSFFGNNQKKAFKTFRSRPKAVKVKDLPPHPLKDRVAVGNYRLRESLSAKQLQTGQSFRYRFEVKGEGNISAITAPKMQKKRALELYEPNVQQDIRRNANTVRGTKSYSYFGIPQDPGTYELKDYLSWIYFNPTTETYDTLRPEGVIQVTGESKINETIVAQDMGSFYDMIELEDQQYVDAKQEELIKLLANIFILIMLVLSVFFIFRK